MNFEKTIVTARTKSIRTIALAGLKGLWPVVTLGVLLYQILIDLPSDFIVESYDVQAALTRLYQTGIFTPPGVPFFAIQCFAFIVSGPLMFGLYRFVLRIFRHQLTRPVEIFLGFNDFGRTFFARLLISLFTALGFILLIVPGFIVLYGFRLTYYLLSEDETLSAWQAMKLSWTIMQGNKYKAFCLELSFIGWYALLGGGTALIAQLSPTIAILLSTIAGAYLSSYVQMSDACFYEMAVGHLRKTEPQFYTYNDPERGSDGQF